AEPRGPITPGPRRRRIARGCSLPPSKWQCQQGIDLATVEHNDAFREAQDAIVGIVDDVIAVTSASEYRSLTSVHHPHDDEACPRPSGAIRPQFDERQTDYVTVALRLVDIGLAQRAHTVAQHGARCGVDDAERQAAFEILGRCHDIARSLREEPWPILKPTVVDRLGIACIEIED